MRIHNIEYEVALRLARKDAERAENEWREALDVLEAAKKTARERFAAYKAAEAKLTHLQERDSITKWY